jgi:salicylate hydroxylase
MKVIVIGAGIAGLTAALALVKKGIDVTVVEQAQHFREIGAGIQIGANGTLVMRELGLEDKLLAVGVIPQAWDTNDFETGRMLFATPLGEEAALRYGAPLYNLHRADLIDLLAKGLPAGVLRFGARCEELGQTADLAWVKLVTGEVLEADAVVGADGIHSMVRERLWGHKPAQAANILMWRALIPGDRLSSVDLPERGHNWTGPGRTIVSYWVRPQKLYSVLASVPDTEVKRESWEEGGNIEEFRQSFSAAEPRLKQLLDQIDTAFITGMYYRDPIETWTSGRITLLGDAAHPMVPFLAQGACQGMEDAWTIATVLSRSNDVPNALREYETRRRPRTTRVQSGARAMVKLVHESDRERIRMRNGRWKGMSRIDPLAETSWGLGWKYDVLKAVDQPIGEVFGLSAVQEGFHLSRPESCKAYDLWKNALTPEDAAQGYDGLRKAYERFLLTNFPPDGGLESAERELNGVRTIRINSSSSKSGPVVLHFHGGGYVVGSADSSQNYAARLAHAVEGECFTVDYRLAPENPYPAALDDAVDAYRGLLREGISPERIILSGESSGGGLAIALAMALRSAGDSLPAGILAVCPFADMTLSGESLRLADGKDPAANRDSLTFLAASYFQGHEPRDPLVSPLFGDFRLLPPLFLTAATNEALFDDTSRILQRAQAQGVDVTVELVDDSVHIYPLFPFLPETKQFVLALNGWSRRILQQSVTNFGPLEHPIAAHS